MTYKIKLTKEQIPKLKPYIKAYRELEDEFYGKVFKLERKMSKEFNIIDMEFFISDNEMVGIGNVERTMGLINIETIEKSQVGIRLGIWRKAPMLEKV
jgi:hypothetical protein